jgi:16S rRNA (guanine527-N7)-methyltransferase
VAHHAVSPGTEVDERPKGHRDIKDVFMKIDSGQWQRTVIEGASALGLKVTGSQARTMSTHARLLLEWNRTTNLTAITDPGEVAVKHYVDSLAAVCWIGAAVRIIDAGSGAGFPGIPLKILRPELSFTLVDSVRKKVSFLKHTIRTIGLEGIEAVHGRLEVIGESPRYRGAFDMVVCRAFSSLETFAERSADFLAPGGSLLALKGPQTDHSFETAGDGSTIRLGGRSFSIHVHQYQLPILNAQRRAVRLTPLTDDG